MAFKVIDYQGRTLLQQELEIKFWAKLGQSNVMNF